MGGTALCRNRRDRKRVAFAIVPLLAGLAAVIADESPAAATTRAFPAGAWQAPVRGAPFEDWGFDSCNPPYTTANGVSKAHLGADSQGTVARMPVFAISDGSVVKVVASNWGPGGAIGVVHNATDGSRFLMVYGHIDVDPSVAVGSSVVSGKQLGTLYDQGSNSHLHIGVRPLSATEDASKISLTGSTTCSGTAAPPTNGFVDPIPYLTARSGNSGRMGRIVQWSGDTKTQKTSWVIGPDMRRRWIKDTATYSCLRAFGTPDIGPLDSAHLAPFPDMTGVAASCGQDTISTGQVLTRGTHLNAGAYHLEFQGDGNLVLYGANGPLWATYATRATWYFVGGDGNIVGYDDSGRAQWSTNTSGTTVNRLTLQGTDGNLVAYTSDTPSIAKWATMTTNGQSQLGNPAGYRING